jgi:ribosomal-protein-alanine N-acetyltransferase
MILIPVLQDGSISPNPPPMTALTRQVTDALAAMYSKNGYQPPWTGYLAVESGEVTGTCAFKGPPKKGIVEIAYFSFPGHEGRGLSTRMARKLMELARVADPKVSLSALTDPEEGASTTILRKLGFTLIGSATHPEEGAVWEWRFTPGKAGDLSTFKN